MSELPSVTEVHSALEQEIHKHIHCVVKLKAEFDVLTHCIKEAEFKCDNLANEIKELEQLGKEAELIDQKKLTLFKEFAKGKFFRDKKDCKAMDMTKVNQDLN